MGGLLKSITRTFLTTTVLFITHLTRTSSFVNSKLSKPSVSTVRATPWGKSSWKFAFIRTSAVTLLLRRSVSNSMSTGYNSVFSPLKIPGSSVSYIDAEKAKQVDEMLMTAPGFSIDQLMELAGYSVACAAHDYYTGTILNSATFIEGDVPKILLVVGPGNNGGDGLVAARHLKHFGYNPTVVYPKQGKSELFLNLVRQCEDLSIDITATLPLLSSDPSEYDLIVDAMFGFSFQGPARAPFSDMIASLAITRIPVLSVDIPSGWNVNDGDIFQTGFNPAATISLTVPKLCMKNYEGKHYVGGRFVPPNVQSSLQLMLPTYGFGPSQIIEISPPPIQELCDADTVTATFVTAGSLEEARKLAHGLIQDKLAACINIVPKIESVYEWEGKVEQSEEYLLIIKSRKTLQDQVVAAVKKLHSYDVPENIVFDTTGGSKDYIDWVLSSTSTPQTK